VQEVDEDGKTSSAGGGSAPATRPPAADSGDSDDSASAGTPVADAPAADASGTDTPVADTPAEDVSVEPVPGPAPLPEDDTVEEQPAPEPVPEPGTGTPAEPVYDWGRAGVLTLGEDEPRRVSQQRVGFPGYRATLPAEYPQNMRSRTNQRQVTLVFRNESGVPVEFYTIQADGSPEPAGQAAPGEIFEIETRQAVTYVVYAADGRYFGDISTTGVQLQLFRLQ
jgi:hypothetical protein